MIVQHFMMMLIARFTRSEKDSDGVARKSWTRSGANSWLGSYFFFVSGLGDVVLEVDGADHPEGFSAGAYGCKPLQANYAKPRVTGWSLLRLNQR
ncbi:hypothetical protein GWO62_01930 [Corynebacterium macginleyi]|uniref:hypothetical protein n=1 Tax=Corynebacterium macginleyi TaxID=38290 RepID=UPI001909BEB5|nr:hypothetical protein [Corynebacterium macginleyi]MBK4151981.1 hypothetical protein [Corynebacterium macginleyi]